MKSFVTILLLFFTLNSAFAQTKSATVTPVSNDTKILSFYPNPAVSFINFNYDKNYDNTHNLQIFNFMGRKILDIKNTTSKMRISLQDFYRGIYIYQLRDKNGKIIESGKFQVVK